jgi:PAS domain-containing protein
MRRLLRVRPLVFSTIAAVVAGTLIVDAYTPSLVASRELLQRLTMERAALAVLVGSVSEGILHVSSAGRIVHANPAARMLLGLPASVSGQPVATLVRNAELRALLESAVESGALGTCEVSVDERRLLVSARPVAGTNGGTPGGVVVALADFSRREPTIRSSVLHVLCALRGEKDS